MSKIHFWKKKSGHFFTHSGGLRQEDVTFLQTLKVGDKLIAFNNDRKDRETSPDLTIKLALERTQEVTPPTPTTSSGGFRPIKRRHLY